MRVSGKVKGFGVTRIDLYKVAYQTGKFWFEVEVGGTLAMHWQLASRVSKECGCMHKERQLGWLQLTIGWLLSP